MVSNQYTMSKDQLKQYCSILKYIRDKDQSLFAAIEDSCLHGVFNPKRVRGITFLYPEDPKYRAEIVKAIYSEDAEKGVRMIEALVLQDYLPTPAEFMARQADIPNALKQKVRVKSVAGGIVTLEGGITLKLDSAFKPIKRRENMAVYILEGGRMPQDGAPATYEYASSGKKSKRGGAMGGRMGDDYEHLDTNRCTFAKTLENEIIEALKSNTVISKDPALEAMCSFLIWCDMKYPDVYRNIVPYLDWLPVASFYIIFEPHMQNPSLVPQIAFERWLTETRAICPHDSIQLPALYERLLNKAAGTLGDAAKRLAARKAIQKSLLSTPYKPTMSQEALAAYHDRIGDAFRDELRLVIFKSIKEMHDANTAKDECCAFQFLVNYMRHIANKVPENNSQIGELMCLNQPQQNANDLVSWISTALAFIRSDCFLYELVDSKTLESNGDLGAKQIDDDNVTVKYPINLSFIKLEMLREGPVQVKEAASVETFNKMHSYISGL